jgi:hypothetical protein
MNKRKTNSLGSTISSFKYKYKHSSSINQQHDVLKIIERLEGYEKYRKQIENERVKKAQKQKTKTKKKIKSLVYQKVYSKRNVINPYVELHNKHHITPDIRLTSKLNSKNLYSIYEFRHLLLPKSNYQITAGHAWGALIKSWKGYYIAKHQGNLQAQQIYASVTQRWVDMLELPYIPDFPEIGVTSSAYQNSKNIKKLD